MTKLILLASLFTSFTAAAQSVLSTLQRIDLEKRVEFKRECEYNVKLLKLNYSIQCDKNYHHYNSSAYKNYSKTKALTKKNIKIAEFNVLHPGMGKSLFKDYKKIAQIINKYDVMGATELIPLVKDDLANNLAVIDYMKKTPHEIVAITEELKSLIKKQQRSRSIVREREIGKLRLKLKRLKKDINKVTPLYRAPGYVKILQELHKLRGGKDWALIISPRGEGAETSPTVELVGYYYRSSIVKPKRNDYCANSRMFGKAAPFACIVNMDAKDLGVDKRQVFSRRPFLGEFISGNFSFVLLTSHVIFDSPKDPKIMHRIVDSAFGVNSYEDLGMGVQKGNYARFAEVKVTLDFIQRYQKKNKKKDIIFMGDLNLQSKNRYWPEILKAWSGSRLFIDEKTSTNQARYRGGEPTNGVTSNYDHFIFNPKITKECVSPGGKLNGGVFDFQKGSFRNSIDRIYKVRYERGAVNGQYRVNQRKYNKVYDRFVAPYATNKKNILTIGKVEHFYQDKYRILSKGIIKDTRFMENYALKFQQRVMDSQLKDTHYYYVYEQLISDHLPIFMECSNQ